LKKATEKHTYNTCSFNNTDRKAKASVLTET